MNIFLFQDMSISKIQIEYSVKLSKRQMKLILVDVSIFELEVEGEPSSSKGGHRQVFGTRFLLAMTVTRETSRLKPGTPLQYSS